MRPFFTFRYDAELTSRLRKRLETTIATVERLGKYRREVLETLARDPLVKVKNIVLD